MMMSLTVAEWTQNKWLPIIGKIFKLNFNYASWFAVLFFSHLIWMKNKIEEKKRKSLSSYRLSVCCVEFYRLKFVKLLWCMYYVMVRYLATKSGYIGNRYEVTASPPWPNCADLYCLFAMRCTRTYLAIETIHPKNPFPLWKVLSSTTFVTILFIFFCVFMLNLLACY